MKMLKKSNGDELMLRKRGSAELHNGITMLANDRRKSPQRSSLNTTTKSSLSSSNSTLHSPSQQQQQQQHMQQQLDEYMDGYGSVDNEGGTLGDSTYYSPGEEDIDYDDIDFEHGDFRTNRLLDTSEDSKVSMTMQDIRKLYNAKCEVLIYHT